MESTDDCADGQGTTAGLVFLIKEAGIVKCVKHASTLPANNTYHIAGSYDGTNLNLYINGELEETNAFSGSIDDDSLPLIIGADDSGYYFNGILDEVRVYNRALDESEIMAMQQWTPTFERLRLLIAGNDYYFRLTDPKTGSTLTNSYGDLIEAGTDPSGIAGSNLMQTAVRRTVTYKGGAAIAEIVLYRVL